MTKIGISDLVNMNDYVDSEPIKIDLVYAQKGNFEIGGHLENHFGQIYQPSAQLYIHKDLAKIVIEAARIVNEKYGWKLVLFDGLRPVEAQEKMLKVKNERKLADDMVSPPGDGAHPRGMAIDMAAVDKDGDRVDFGANYDQFDEMAGRDFEHYPGIMECRKKLNDAMLEAAKNQGKEEILELFETEFWDFRFKKDVWSKYDALEEENLRQMGLERVTAPSKLKTIE